MKRALLAFLLFAAIPAFGRVQSPPTPPKTTFHAELEANLADVESKLVRLAEVTPAEKYEWRPTGDVRSISEVYMHIAGSNYFLTTFLGVKPPGTMPDHIESITDKQRVLAELRKSFEHVRAAAAATSEADLERPVKMFGTQTTYRGVFVTILNHIHEHLGQSIAYARINGVKPPWS